MPDTHRERLLALLTDFGITPGDQDPQFVTLEASKGGVGGQHPLQALFQFDEAGAFKTVGIYLD